MGFLKGFIKVIEALLLLLVPTIIFYWFLTLIDLEFVKPFSGALGVIFIPFINIVGAFVHYKATFDETVIDFTPLFFAAIVLIGFIFCSGMEKIIDIFENMAKEAQKRVKAEEDKQNEEIQQMRFLEELAKNKVVYFVLRFRKKETSSAYLYNKEDDLFGSGVLTTMMNDIVNNSKNFKAKQIKEVDNGQDVFNFIFYNITDAIDYSFYVYNKVAGINKEVLDQGEKLFFGISCHCSYSESTFDKDLGRTAKMLSLGGDNEIIVSELFKNKYEALKAETNLAFTTKGIYNISDDQIEIYAMKATDKGK